MSRVPPELINLENQMDDFFAEMRRQNERIVNPAPTDSLWADAHMRFHFPESESEADRKFIESVEKIRAANKALPSFGITSIRAARNFTPT